MSLVEILTKEAVMAKFDAFADFRMDGHVALVTGGAQNIGEAIARTFSGAGAKVMIADLNGEKAQATANAIREATGNEVRGVRCNVTVEADVNRCVEDTVKAFGSLSTLVNNVGWGKAHDDPMNVPEAEMIESYKLNTLSAMRMTAACRPHLLEAKNPSITSSGSMVGVLPAFDFIAYSAAKAARRRTHALRGSRRQGPEHRGHRSTTPTGRCAMRRSGCASTELELPLLEYRPIRSVAAKQTFVLAFQLGYAVDWPSGLEVLNAPDVAVPHLTPAHLVFLRLGFDSRLYF